MDLLNKLHWRYAVKKFDDSKKIKEEDIQYLIEGTRMTASSMGLQGFKLINIEKTELRNKLVEASMGQDKVAKASHLFVFAVMTDINQAIDSYMKAAQKANNLSDEKTATLGKRILAYASKKSNAELNDWLTKQTYIALGNLLTLCAEKDIDACPMEGFSKTSYDKILGLDKHGLSSTVIITLGYRASDDNYAQLKKVRKPTHDFLLTI